MSQKKKLKKQHRKEMRALREKGGSIIANTQFGVKTLNDTPMMIEITGSAPGPSGGGSSDFALGLIIGSAIN